MQTSTSTSTTMKESKSTSIQANLEEELLSQMETEKQDFSQAFLFSDAILIVEEKLLHCHRVILSLNSPVFKLLFEGNFKEADSKVVKLPDDYDDILALLRYLYEFNARDFSAEKARKLLPVVHKYQIKELIDQFERTLIASTPEFESINLIQLANKYNLDKMRQAAVETMAKFPLEKCKKLIDDNEIPFDIRSQIMERRVWILEHAIGEIQKSFSNSCLKLESKVTKTPSNHCSAHGGPLTCISFVSQSITNGYHPQNIRTDQLANVNLNAGNQENPRTVTNHSNVSASIQPFAGNFTEIRPPQQNPAPDTAAVALNASSNQIHENGVCSDCVDNLKSHITDICMRSMHKVPIILFKP